MAASFSRQTNIPLAIVVAMAENNVIGKGNELPWRLSDDLKYFKKNTYGKPIIMGHKTYCSIGRALPGRDTIVISRNPDRAYAQVTIAPDLEDAIAIGEAFALAREVSEICLIGGGEIYRQALPLVKKIYLTRVHADIEGDVYFPELDEDEWHIETVGRIGADAKNQYDAEMFIYTRKDRMTP